MAKVKPSRSSGKAPISRHPLFPATVALWFGALFGIGSLAIRPSLIEGFVTSLAIDVIIPAAAPPLGATTRILLALTLAAIGGTLGASLARRITSPKPVPTQRKRAAAKAGEALSPMERVGTTPAGRRGRLALDEDSTQRKYVDHAPLPGGASILDVSQFDLEGFETEEPEETPMITEPEPAFNPEPAAERAHWSSEADAQPVQPSSEPFEAPLQSAPEPDYRSGLPGETEAYSPEPEVRRAPEGVQVFQPITGQEPDFAGTGHADGVEAEATAVAEPAPEPAAFAQTAEPYGYEAVEPTVEGAPFMKPGAPAFGSPGQAPFAPPVDNQSMSPAFAMPQEEATPTAPQLEPEPLRAEGPSLPRLGDDSFEPLPPRVRPGSIFDQKPTTSLFAQPHLAQVANVKWDSPAPSKTEQVSEFALPVESLPTAEPESVAPPADQRIAPMHEPAAAGAAERIASAPLDELSHVELLERLALSMLRKRSPSEPEHPASPPLAESGPKVPVEDVQPAPAPPVPCVPDALRPIGLDDDDDSDFLPAFVPPRHFAQAPSGNAPAPAQPVGQTEGPDIPVAPEPAPAEGLDEGYSSLLSLSRPGTGVQRFVRIEESASLSGEIEPVVIFPGKEPSATRAQPAASAHAAASGQHDPDETDRALRTALANLQRMSGAA